MRDIISHIFFDETYSNISGQYSSKIEHYKNEIHSLFLDDIYVCVPYKEIHSLLEAFKYRSEQNNIELFGSLLAQSPIFSSISDKKSFCIVPAPMHWSRYLIRGYNHTKLLAKELSRLTGIEVHCLLGTSFSYRQSKLSKVKRIQNRKDTIYLKNGSKIPDIVILLDDVISTGSTANECARILKNAGVKIVYGLFLASNQD